MISEEIYKTFIFTVNPGEVFYFDPLELDPFFGPFDSEMEARTSFDFYVLTEGITFQDIE